MTTLNGKHLTNHMRNKVVIEAAGFTQIIKGITRYWHGQADSLPDQCWVNKPNRVISFSNELRGSSNHNLIYVILRTKDKYPSGLEVLRRQWKHFDPDTFRQKVAELNWGSFYETSNIDVMNNILEENLTSILDIMAPMKDIQLTIFFRNWVDEELKLSMKMRDNQREIAKTSDFDIDWINYRRMRNDCSMRIVTREKMSKAHIE